MNKMKNAFILCITLLLSYFVAYGQIKKNQDIYDYPVPKNLNESFKLLDKTLDKEVIFLIKSLPEDSILTNKTIEYEMDFPYAWKIYDGSRLTKYFNKKGLFEPNYIYETILVAYHRYLNESEINLEQQIEKYNAIFEKEASDNFERKFKEQNEKLLYKGIRTCLSAYIQQRKEFLDAGIVKTFNRLTVSMDGFPPNFYFENTVDDIAIRYISLTHYHSLKKELQKGIGVLSLSKIEIKDITLEISFAYYNAKLLGDNHFNMAVVDSMTCIYEYSCEKNEWILTETKYGSV